jgi:hypothetical protein
MANPVPKKVTPSFGAPGDVFTVTITGDAFSDVVSARELTVKVYINGTAAPAKCDVTLTDKHGGTGTLRGGFSIL